MLLDRVLIVEDDRELAKVLRRYLEAQGYEILLAHKGCDALQMCQTEPLAALLLDIKLPDLDGYRVLTSLRHSASTQYLPVIILSQKDERLPTGVELQRWDDYLTKPFDFAELNRCLRQTIDESRRQAPASPSPQPSGRGLGDLAPPPLATEGRIEEGLKPPVDLKSMAGSPSESAESLDHTRQLTEQIFLWEKVPALARVLIEADRLIANRVHDMSKIGALLSLVKATDASAKTFQQLQQHLYRCRLAYENLNVIGYKLRRYQPFSPTSLAGALANIPAWFDASDIIDLSAVETAEVRVALSQLRLQQLLYNTCQWLLQSGASRLRLTLETGGEAIRLYLSPAGDHRPILGWLEGINNNSDEAIYAYLTHKIVTRYGGACVASPTQVRLTLPGIAPTKLDEQILIQNVETNSARLATFEDLTEAASSTYQAARRLIDPLAADLLVKLEATSNLLNTAFDIDVEASPWSAIYRNVSFFKLLTFDLGQHQPLNPEPVDLPALLRQIQPLLAHYLIDHQIVFEIDEQPAVLVTDKSRLLLSLLHIAMNALEAMPDGGTVYCRIWHRPEDVIHIEVADTGVGISASFLPDQVFKRQVTTKGLGRGLGLYHVRRYIEDLGGQIKIESATGQGSKVSVDLPSAYFHDQTPSRPSPI